MKYIDAERLKAEIERRKQVHFDDYFIKKSGNPADYGASNALAQVLSLIDSLQQEQKLEVKDPFDDGQFRRGYESGYADAKREQKPAEWSEEDADMLNCCISSIEEAKENRYAYKETDGDTSYDREIDWLKSLRPSWKPSDEQLRTLEYAIDYFKKKRNDTTYLESLYNDLKKLM